MAKNSKKIIKKKFLKPITFGVLAVFLLIIVIQIANPMNTAQKSAVQEVVMPFGDDLNEMREYLLLPQRDYSYLNNEISQNLSDDTLSSQSIYRFVNEVGGSYLSDKKKETSYQKILDLKKDNDFYQKITAIGLLPARYLDDTAESAKYKFYLKQDAIAQLVLDKENSEFYIQSIIGTEYLIWNEDSSLKDVVLKYISDYKDNIIAVKARIAEQKEAIIKLWDDEDLKNILSDNKLQPNLNPTETESGFEYVVQNMDGTALIAITINRKNGDFIFENIEYVSIELLIEPLSAKLQTLSGESQRTISIQEKKEELEEMLFSDEFTKSLISVQLNIQPGREENNRILYDLLNTEDENKIGSIIFETETGNIFFFRASDNAELSIDDLMVGSKKNDLAFPVK